MQRYWTVCAVTTVTILFQNVFRFWTMLFTSLFLVTHFWYKESRNAWVSVVSIRRTQLQCYSPCLSQFQTPWQQENGMRLPPHWKTVIRWPGSMLRFPIPQISNAWQCKSWSAIHAGLHFLTLFCRHLDQVSKTPSETLRGISRIPLPSKHTWRIRHQ